MILTLEQQVVSREPAEKLKALGCPQAGALFYWSDAEWDERSKLSRSGQWRVRSAAIPEPEFSIAAYTVAELGTFLRWQALLIFGVPDNLKDLMKDGDTQADTYAKFLIYMLERKLITLPSTQ